MLVNDDDDDDDEQLRIESRVQFVYTLKRVKTFYRTPTNNHDDGGVVRSVNRWYNSNNAKTVLPKGMRISTMTEREHEHPRFVLRELVFTTESDNAPT